MQMSLKRPHHVTRTKSSTTNSVDDKSDLSASGHVAFRTLVKYLYIGRARLDELESEQCMDLLAIAHATRLGALEALVVAYLDAACLQVANVLHMHRVAADNRELAAFERQCAAFVARLDGEKREHALANASQQERTALLAHCPISTGTSTTQAPTTIGMSKTTNGSASLF